MIKNFEGRRVLIAAPHTDDGEFGCGGTISWLLERGADVYYLAFSAAEQSVLPHLPKDILRTEVKKAIEVLGIPQDHLILDKIPVRHFNSHRQAILEEMIRIRTELDPEIVFCPSLDDIHQDHQVVAQESLRAFKKCTILGYEMPWNNLQFKTSSFFVLEEKHVQCKIEALSMYESQKHRSYASEEFLRALAVTRGTQIGAKYAEAFELVRMVF